MLELTIEDDGPGIPEDQAKLALQRGHRLDETKPGTGLVFWGWRSCPELVAEYGGELLLDPAQIGGLRVRVRLKQAQGLSGKGL